MKKNCLLFNFVSIVMIPGFIFSQQAPLDAQAITQVDLPVPDASAVVAPVVPQQTVTPTQLTWPDTVTFSDSDNAETTVQTDNPKIIEMFKQTADSIDQTSIMSGQMVKVREDLYKQYFDLDISINEFFQNTKFSAGTIQSSGTSQKLGSKQDLAQINSFILTISAFKESIKKLLAKIDADIEKTKNIIAQIRKKNMTILNQATEQAAGVIQTDINQNITSIKAMQQELQGPSTQSFQALINQVQTTIKTAQNILAQAQTKIEAAQVAQDQAEIALSAQSKQQSAQQAPFQTWLIPEQETAHKQQEVTPDKTMIHYVLRRLADGITEGSRIAYMAYLASKHALFGPEKQQGAPVQQQASVPVMQPASQPTIPPVGQSMYPASPQTPVQNAPVMPPTLPQAPENTPVMPAAK